MLLFTGASGFLGKNICACLAKKYQVETLGLSHDDHYEVDISKQVPMLKHPYRIVLHAAGKAHSIPSDKNESDLFFQVNLQGTKNLCQGLELTGYPETFIFISTVAVYGVDSGMNIKEENSLNGSSPYALSKIKAEEFLIDWCQSKKVKLGILRPSLIAGNNPPGNLGAMIEGIRKGRYIRIGDGKVRKSIVMAEDISRVLPRLAEVGGIYNLCDDTHPYIYEMEELIASQLGKSHIPSIPAWGARGVAFFGDFFGSLPLNTERLNKLLHPLTFSNEKAKKDLNWEPLNVLRDFRVF